MKTPTQLLEAIDRRMGVARTPTESPLRRDATGRLIISHTMPVGPRHARAPRYASAAASTRRFEVTPEAQKAYPWLSDWAAKFLTGGAQ